MKQAGAGKNENSNRPGTRGSNGTSKSEGVITISSELRAGSDVMGEVAEDVSSAMFDGVFQDVSEQGDDDAETQRQIVAALQTELANAQNEIERATLKEAQQEKWAAEARQEIADLKAREIELKEQFSRECQDSRDEVASLKANSERELQNMRRHLHDASQISTASPGGDLDECNALRHKVSVLEGELSTMMTREPSKWGATAELAAEGSEETQLLASAYQQISVLNTQLAHLYTELTMARTEAQHLRAQHGGEDPQSLMSASGSKDNSATQKQSQQIADLVSDIRHLQLDLEYHQQKLDQMIEEKQVMMKDLKSCQAELAQAKEMLTERDQRLKHQEVDLKDLGRLRQLQYADSSQDPSKDAAGAEMVTALRGEATAKDSALIMSHYELHKEKIMRDRLEQKNLQLMDRMQKLMMVVETMRKDNLSLERSLACKERSYEEKELQLQQVTQRTKQLVKHTKLTPRTRPAEISQGLPPLRSPGTA
jgi:hypothetical protein